MEHDTRLRILDPRPGPRHHYQEEREEEKEKAAEASDGQEKEKQGGAPAPVGYWSPELKHVRKESWTKFGITTVLLCAFIIACLSIYWGVFVHAEKNLSSLVVYVVDFDGQVAPYNDLSIEPVVGPAVVRLAQQMVASSQPTLGYGSLPASDFDGDPLQVRKAVYDWECWAAIIVMPNATSMLLSAVQNGNTSYDPRGAMQLVYQDARDDTNWYVHCRWSSSIVAANRRYRFDFMAPLITEFQTQATSTVGEQWARQILQEATNNQTLARNIAQVPQAISPAVGFSTYNLRPFYPYVAIPAVSIGLIYLIIISFFSFSFYLPIHMKASLSADPLPTHNADQYDSTSNPKAIHHSSSTSSSSGACSRRFWHTFSYLWRTRSSHWRSRSTSPAAYRMLIPMLRLHRSAMAILRLTGTERSWCIGCLILLVWVRLDWLVRM